MADVEGFRLEQGGLQDLLRSDGMAAAMRARAQVGLEWAQAEARRSAYLTGAYADAFVVTSHTEKVNGLERPVAVLANTDPKAWAVEWGNGGHHILARSADVIRKAGR